MENLHDLLVTFAFSYCAPSLIPGCRRGEQGHSASCTSIMFSTHDSIPIHVCVQVCVHVWIHSAGRIIRKVANSQYHYSEDDYCMYNYWHSTWALSVCMSVCMYVHVSP